MKRDEDTWEMSIWRGTELSCSMLAGVHSWEGFFLFCAILNLTHGWPDSSWDKEISPPVITVQVWDRQAVSGKAQVGEAEAAMEAVRSQRVEFRGFSSLLTVPSTVILMTLIMLGAKLQSLSQWAAPWPSVACPPLTPSSVSWVLGK